MPEKLPLFLISRIRTSHWQNTHFHENGYEYGIRFGPEWAAGG